MWLKSLKVGDTLFLRRDDNRRSEGIMFVVKIGRKYLYAAPSIDSHAYQQIKICMDSGRPIDAPHVVYRSREDYLHTVKMQKLSLMAGNALLYSRPTDEQITAIAEILGLAL